MQKYAIAKRPTPILNRSDFSYVFGGSSSRILLDDIGLLRPLEMIALEGECFECKMQVSENIFEVSLKAYPCNYPLYIDKRFVEFTPEKPKFPKRELPAAEKILSSLEKMLHLPYIWGGNISTGIEEMKRFYPINDPGTLTPLQRANWTFSGVDCSGMLYEAANGNVPRNSSWMQKMGEPLDIEGKSIKEIANLLKPLDAILWPTHVLFVFDQNFTIESRAHRGLVFKTKILERLEQIEEIEKRIPMNTNEDHNFLQKGFIIRRWYPDLD